MDYRPPTPTLTATRDGVSINGRRPLDYERARGLASELCRLVQTRPAGAQEIYHHNVGMLPLLDALDLAERLFAAQTAEVRRGLTGTTIDAKGNLCWLDTEGAQLDAEIRLRIAE